MYILYAYANKTFTILKIKMFFNNNCFIEKKKLNIEVRPTLGTFKT